MIYRSYQKIFKFLKLCCQRFSNWLPVPRTLPEKFASTLCIHYSILFKIGLIFFKQNIWHLLCIATVMRLRQLKDSPLTWLCRTNLAKQDSSFNEKIPIANAQSSQVIYDASDWNLVFLSVSLTDQMSSAMTSDKKSIFTI